MKQYKYYDTIYVYKKIGDVRSYSISYDILCMGLAKSTSHIHCLKYVKHI